jgi:hypothetical protein
MQNSEVLLMTKTWTQTWAQTPNRLFSIALACTLASTLVSTLVSAIGSPSIAADKPKVTPASGPAKTGEAAKEAAAKAAAEKAGAAAEKAGEAVNAGDAPFWIPAARLATDKPQRIEVKNKTGVILDYLITTHTDFRTLAPGKSITLTNFTTPVFLNINPQESNYLVAYKVSVNAKTNTLIVNVTLTNSLDNRTLNLDETGAVYLY